MGIKEFFRGFGLKLSKSLLTTLIMLAIATFAFVSITDQAFLKPVFTDFIAQQLTADPEIAEGYDNLVMLCQAQKKEIITFPLEGLDQNIDLNCTELKSGGKANFTQFFAETATESMFGSIYNSNVCSGPDCLEVALNAEDPMQRISAVMNARFNEYVAGWNRKFIMIAVLCVLLILLLAQGWPSKLMGVGVPLAFAGIPYFFIGSLQAKLETSLPSRALFAIGEMINSLSNAFLAMFIVGVTLTIAGFALKIYLKKRGGSPETEKKTPKNKSKKK